MKTMIEENFPRDRIISFFIRPGRVISPAVKSEVQSGKIGRDIEPATTQELARFVAARLNEVRPFGEAHYGGPLSQMRVNEVLALSRDAQASLPGFEGQFAEYKEEIPQPRNGFVKLSRTISSFANARGGYIFFGIDDARRVVGIEVSTNLDKTWQKISQCVSESFTPAVRCEYGLIHLDSKAVGVIYVYEADTKPIISNREYGNELHRGQIFFRYDSISKPIEAGDLLSILAERDRQIVSRAGTRVEPSGISEGTKL